MLGKSKNVIILLLLITSLTVAQQTNENELIDKKLPFGLLTKSPKHSPKIALVLSGGGSRGIAHLGILKVLEEEGIKPDYIIGTSMGSIIGGLYASGYSTHTLDSIILSAPWADFYSTNDHDRRELFLDQKITDDKALFELRLKKLKPIIPTYLNSGQKISSFINMLTLNAPIYNHDSFDDLLVPYRAVGTDLISGKEVVLKNGSLSRAMRASSSVSFLLPPIRIDSMMLVDGGLVANVPVNAALEFNPDIIIACDVTSPLRQKDELKFPWEIADQLVSIPMKILKDQQLEKADVVITPELEEYKNNHFDNLNGIIEKGEIAARDNVVKIKKIILNRDKDYFTREDFQFDETVKSIEFTGDKLNSEISLGNFFSHLINEKYNPSKTVSASLELLSNLRKKGLTLAHIDKINFHKSKQKLTIEINDGVLDDLIITGNSKTNESVIKREMEIYGQLNSDYKSIFKGLTNLRTTNLYDDLELSYVTRSDSNYLKLNVDEKLSRAFRFGLRIDNEYLTQVSIDVREENLFGTASELGMAFFGGLKNRKLEIEHKSNRVFDSYLTYKIKAYLSLRDVGFYEDDTTQSKHKYKRDKTGEYKQVLNGISVGVGTQVEKFGNLFVEGIYESNEIKNKFDYFGDIGKYNVARLRASLSIDSQDKYPFPNDGFRVYGYYETAQEILGGDISYTKIFIDYKNYISLSKDHILAPRIRFGFADETLPLTQQFSLGGQDSFMGLREDEFRGRQIFSTSIQYRYKLPVDIFFKTYVKVHYDLGGIWANESQIRFKDLRHGAGITLSFDTPIGPADFSAGRAFYFRKTTPINDIVWGPVSLYFTIGYYY